MGTLTPGQAHRTPEQIPGNSKSSVPRTNGSQAQARSQRWQPDFPGLWDDVPGSGTTITYNNSAGSNIPHTRPYPLPQPNQSLPALSMAPEGLAGPACRLPERQATREYHTGDGRIVELKHHRL
ncbi:unnamed protein product [Rhizoctonia solani]|uniref:Uncharacterized protein n=1 Tax=Rhizoctonia solani TaxID=456999 RepID=A0A8H3DPH4_9AGAM|nr:unnamed protein product [Rhizoctonia solani]